MFSNAVEWFCFVNQFSSKPLFITQLSNLMGEDPPGVLSEVEICRCAPLNQCDMKSSSDGISMIIATTLFMYQVDHNIL